MVAGALVSYAGYRWWEAVLPDTVSNLFRRSAPVLADPGIHPASSRCGRSPPPLSSPSCFSWPCRKLAEPAAGGGAGVGGLQLLRRLRAAPRGSPQAVPDPQPHVLQRSAGRRYPRMSTPPACWPTRGGWLGGFRRIRRPRDAQVFRAQCASCHTIDGYQAIRPAAADGGRHAGGGRGRPAGVRRAAFGRSAPLPRRLLATTKCGRCCPPPDEIDDDPEFIRELNHGMIYGTLVRLLRRWVTTTQPPTTRG